MKFNELRSIAHNVAHSLASGVGLMVGYYHTDIFGEASRSPGGCIAVDFLGGTCVSGKLSPSLTEAVALYKGALSRLCEREGTSISAFRELTVRYSTYIDGPHFVVTLEDQRGHRSIDEYAGWSGSRLKVLDHLGRLRRKARVK